MVVRDQQDEGEFFDGSLVQAFVEGAGGRAAIAHAHRAGIWSNYPIHNMIH